MKKAVRMNTVRKNQNSRPTDGDITVQLISSFKSLISEGKFVAGRRLPPERELAKQFMVNRSSLRQALKVLQLMGVVSQRVGDGTYLSTDATKILHLPMEFLILMGDLSHEELFEARLIVEPELAARAAERATSHDLADLRRAIADLEKSQSDQSRINADLAFHEAIFRASGNRVCHMIFTVIHRAILVSRERIAKTVDVERPLKFHKEINSAICQRKPDEARRKMIEHLLDAKSLLLNADTQGTDETGLRTLLAADPKLRAGIDCPIFETEPAIVFCRRDRAMVDMLLEVGADINARSQFWGRTVGVLDDNTPEMRAYLIQRGAVPEIDEFVEAVKAQDAAKVRTLLANAPALRQHIDQPLFSFGRQAIIAAKNNRQIVETLLEFGANINARSDWWAGSFGVLDGTDPEQADWLIQRGAIVDIHAAAGLGMLDKVKEWLAADPSLVHAPGGDGQRPLHFAKTKEIIDLLLDHGAEINARDIDHKSTAAQYKVRDMELCRHLIARGADVDIFMATALGDRALVERVLNADPGCITARIGQPGYAPVPPFNIYQWKLGAGLSVLLVAAEFGGQDVYDLLFSRSPIKEQFLAVCRRADEASAQKILVAHPNLLKELPAKDKAQIVEAAFANDLPALKLMLKLGFDVNTRCSEGFTPVARAALCGYVEIVRVLIEHGANLEIRNNYGVTALESCQWGSLNFRDPKGDYPACAEALLQAGAKLS